jgi:N-acetylglucosamine-6-phosphate deacetylase
MAEVFAKRIHTDGNILKNQLIKSKNGIITSIEEALSSQMVNSVPFLAPGFIDIQINGGEKLNFTQTSNGAAVFLNLVGL